MKSGEAHEPWRIQRVCLTCLCLLFSDPFHDRYGQHLSKEEVEDLVAPEADSVHLVNEWLASHGVYEDGLTRSPAKDWVHIKIPVALAEEMLKTVCAAFFHICHVLMRLALEIPRLDA